MSNISSLVLDPVTCCYVATAGRQFSSVHDCRGAAETLRQLDSYGFTISCNCCLLTLLSLFCVSFYVLLWRIIRIIVIRAVTDNMKTCYCHYIQLHWPLVWPTAWIQSCTWRLNHLCLLLRLHYHVITWSHYCITNAERPLRVSIKSHLHKAACLPIIHGLLVYVHFCYCCISWRFPLRTSVIYGSNYI